MLQAVLGCIYRSSFNVIWNLKLGLSTGHEELTLGKDRDNAGAYTHVSGLGCRARVIPMFMTA